MRSNLIYLMPSSNCLCSFFVLLEKRWISLQSLWNFLRKHISSFFTIRMQFASENICLHISKWNVYGLARAVLWNGHETRDMHLTLFKLSIRCSVYERVYLSQLWCRKTFFAFMLFIFLFYTVNIALNMSFTRHFLSLKFKALVELMRNSTDLNTKSQSQNQAKTKPSGTYAMCKDAFNTQTVIKIKSERGGRERERREKKNPCHLFATVIVPW